MALNKNRKVNLSLHKRYLGDIEKDFIFSTIQASYHLHMDSFLCNTSGENVVTDLSGCSVDKMQQTRTAICDQLLRL